jgi:hypothetical protein
MLKAVAEDGAVRVNGMIWIELAPMLGNAKDSTCPTVAEWYKSRTGTVAWTEPAVGADMPMEAAIGGVPITNMGDTCDGLALEPISET